MTGPPPAAAGLESLALESGVVTVAWLAGSRQLRLRRRNLKGGKQFSCVESTLDRSAREQSSLHIFHINRRTSEESMAFRLSVVQESNCLSIDKDHLSD